MGGRRGLRKWTQLWEYWQEMLELFIVPGLEVQLSAVHGQFPQTASETVDLKAPQLTPGRASPGLRGGLAPTSTM